MDTSAQEQDQRVLAAGESLYASGATGHAWVVVAGSVRLDREDAASENGFAGVAIKGDVLGAETLLLGRYTFTATALTPCVLEPWPGEARLPEPLDLLGMLARTERRCADAVALRSGTAQGRVQRLVAMMAEATSVRSVSRLMLPTLRDMADITALTIGTVSRILAGMQADGVVQAGSTRRGRPPAHNESGLRP